MTINHTLSGQYIRVEAVDAHDDLDPYYRLTLDLGVTIFLKPETYSKLVAALVDAPPLPLSADQKAQIALDARDEQETGAMRCPPRE